MYYPRYRFDAAAYWKVPANRQVVLGAGLTRFHFGQPGKGQVLNIAAIYYRRRLILKGDFYQNRNQPGDLYSAGGSAAAQYGAEGRYWAGVTVSGGRELYRCVGIAPVDINLAGHSVTAFYRKWLTRHTGVVFTVLYMRKIAAYQQLGGSAKLFFEF